MKFLLPLAIGATFLPIWRVPGRPHEGMNLWGYIGHWLSGEVKHIPIEQAREEAYYIYIVEEGYAEYPWLYSP